MAGGKSKVVPRNSWGWGRLATPIGEVFAWEKFPWYVVYLLWVAVPGGITYSVACCNTYAWFILFPVLAVILALPIFAACMVAYSRVVAPAGPGVPEKFWTFKDKEFEKQYKGQKIPTEHLYEAFFDGKIDLKGDLLETLYERQHYSRPIIVWNHIRFFLLQFVPELLAHTKLQDITQVRGHYDRGNDFYNAFLGESMTYTSGIFHNANDTLEQAQKNKMDLVCQKIHLEEGHEHLDIGCGWGPLVRFASKNYKSQSVGVTLSKNQHAYATEKIKEEGVSANANIICADYRDIPTLTNNKKYDRITCLEMAEHVGVKHFNSFLLQVRDMLKDDGIFYLQIAGLRRAWQYEDLCWGLFMGKYVFPGADASCPLGWVINQLEAAGWEVHSEETIGIHYSATIKRWYDNWVKNQAAMEKKYGQRLYRVWLWFLAWAVISPESGMASCYQIVLHKNTSAFDRKIYIAERSQWRI